MPSARPPTGWNRVAPTWACATRSDPAFHLKMQLDAGAKAPAFFFPRIHKPNRRMGRAQRNPSTREPGHADGLTRSAVESRWALPMLRYLDMPMGFAALYPSYDHGSGQIGRASCRERGGQ